MQIVDDEKSEIHAPCPYCGGNDYDPFHMADLYRVKGSHLVDDYYYFVRCAQNKNHSTINFRKATSAIYAWNEGEVEENYDGN